jgi:predicted PurR-regulated permease PerM
MQVWHVYLTLPVLMDRTSNLPFFVRVSQVLVGLVALFFILYACRGILVPLLFSLIVAILLDPLVNFLTRHRVNRLVSIGIGIAIGLTLVAALVFFISSQVTSFTDALPALEKKFNQLFDAAVSWISNTFRIEPTRIKAWFNKAKNDADQTGMIGQTLGTISGVLVSLVLVPVYIFLFLFYKPLLISFMGRVFTGEGRHTVSDVLHQVKSIIKSYLIGLLLEAAIVATLNSIGLLLMGVPYAIMFGVLGALLNMIPYIGILFAMVLTMLMAAATEPMSTVLMVVGLYFVVQLIDNNFIVPRIVASKVKINALISIIAVISGGALWGIPGMFLSLPLTAIVKIICDHVEQLKPVGFLLGDEVPGSTRWKMRFRKKPAAPAGKKS